ncbi:MAG: hypothetical protein K0V04_30740 [Deltaproteobacteria bacterium]|nr:hypothetical protein [Deltaproteobacteria bacterium]
MHPANHTLLQIPLVQRLRTDPGVRIVRRQCDVRWLYENRSTKASLGWSPQQGEICIAKESPTASWLDDPSQDLRELNEGDVFINELSFAIHDYLHVWALDVIRTTVPQLDCCVAPLHAGNVEEHVLALLITEAVATVGLDYWCLCQRDLESELEIGSNFRTLTVSYDHRRQDEYRRFSPDLEIDHPSFLGTLAEFYATGRFPGFDAAALRRSPCVLSWLKHELSYGKVQRKYSRLWLQHLSGRHLYDQTQLATEVSTDVPWYDALIESLSQQLWSLVKDGGSSHVRNLPSPDDTWRAPDRGPIDFRFTNLNALDDPRGEVSRRGVHPHSRPQWREQLLRRRRFPQHDDDFALSLTKIDDEALFRWSVEQLEPDPGLTLEATKDMFFLK